MAHNPAHGSSSHDRMLGAALRLFAQQGFARTTTAQVARAAGTSESQLIKHFRTKEGLLDAIFENSWRELNVDAATLIASTQSPASGVRMLLRFALRRLDQQPELKRLLLFEGRRVREHGLDVSPGFRQFTARIDSLLRQARRLGQLKTPLPIAAVRSVLIGGFEGLLRDRLMATDSRYPASYSARDVERAMRALIDTFIESDSARYSPPSPSTSRM